MYLPWISSYIREGVEEDGLLMDGKRRSQRAWDFSAMVMARRRSGTCLHGDDLLRSIIPPHLSRWESVGETLACENR